LTIFRSNQGGGKYTPASNEADWVAHIERNEHVGFKLNEKGIAISIFEDLKKNPSKFSMFKNIHAQIYIQAAIYAQEKNIGDVLVLNSDDNIIEATSSNVFLVSGGDLYTPKLSSGPVGGVMRATIINLAISMGIKVFECNLTPQELLKADEVFLTNAVQGIKWVASYRTKRYFNKTANKLLDAFNASIK
jgi:branched-chain amino acid aminotransferase